MFLVMLCLLSTFCFFLSYLCVRQQPGSHLLQFLETGSHRPVGRGIHRTAYRASVRVLRVSVIWGVPADHSSSGDAVSALEENCVVPADSGSELAVGDAGPLS